MPNKTLVPDKLQGYLLQVKHMLYELISVDDRVVSVEKLDDVAVEVEGMVVAEQLKSVTSANNPLAERSPVFWKTLYNWCTYIEEGSLPVDAVLRFVVIANGTIKPGGIQESFANAHSVQEAQTALDCAKAIILKQDKTANPTVDPYATVPETYREYVQYIFDGKRTGTVCSIIKAMQIEIHSDTYDADLYERFCDQTIPPEYAVELLTYMLGWVTQKVESFTKDNKPAYITSQEYRDALTAQIRASNVGIILRAVSAIPTPAEAGGEVERLDTYIKQLKMIEADETALFEAASDYLRTKTEKTEWAQRGIITEQSFDDYHDALCRTWTNRKQLAALQFGADCIRCGQAVYAQCKIDSGTQKLQGVETPPFFGSGSLQGLANDPVDSPRIGWHPQYAELLRGGKA
jgi:hypothetical protein